MRALVLALTAAIAATTPPAEQQTGASRVALATVTDPRNKPLVDVSADDFVIQEAGVARDILSIRPADYPIVVLLDTGTDARADLPLMRTAAAQFIERIGQRPIALGTFGGTPKMLTTFEDERQTVLERLASAAVDTSAGSAMLEGAALAGRTIRETGTLFSALVILSATASDASGSPVDETIALIVDSNAILHVVANRRGADFDFRGLSPSENRDLAPSRMLRALAEQSRGELTLIYSASSYRAALDRLADRLNAEMMIEYLVPIGSKPNDVKVGVRIAGAKVRGLGVAPR